MRDRWSRSSVLLHWLTAAFIVGLTAGGFIMSDLPPDSGLRLVISRLHTVSGFGLMFLTVVRLVVRSRSAPTPLALPELHLRGVRVVHGLMYAATFALGASGVGMAAKSEWPSYVRGELSEAPDLAHLAPREVHEAAVFTLLLLVALHVGGVILQQVRHGRTLRRMLPFLE